MSIKEIFLIYPGRLLLENEFTGEVIVRVQRGKC